MASLQTAQKENGFHGERVASTSLGDAAPAADVKSKRKTKKVLVHQLVRTAPHVSNTFPPRSAQTPSHPFDVGQEVILAVANS